MIVRHVETRPRPEPSVRFYRSIAISFLVLTVVLLGVVVFITSKKATLVILAKEDPKNINLMVNVAANNKDETGQIFGSVSSTVFSWSEVFYPTGTKTVTGAAGGEVTIYNKSSTPQTLIKTTRLLNPEGVLFRLSDRVTIPANGQIKALVYADKPGVESVIGPSQFIIPGLSKDKQSLIYAESLQTMGGDTRQVGVVSENDLQAAKAAYAEKVKQAYFSAVSSTLLDKGVALSVVTNNPNINHQAGDEVESFSLSGTSTIVLVTFDKEELNNSVKSAMLEKVDTSKEKILSVGNAPKVELVTYDVIKQVAQLSVYQDAVVTLDANSIKLAPQNFLGKKKDEIERYVLSLDHVSNVEVKFSPGWMLSAPNVPDNIKILVKNEK